MSEPDFRRVPARSDLAAAHLLGAFPAPRYAEGVPHQVSAAVAPLRARPDPDAEQETQVLFGETFTVYDEAGGFAWGQAQLDGYVGYVDVEALSAPVVAPTHKIIALRTYVFSRASLKSAPHYLLSMNARVTVEDREGRYLKLARSGWVPDLHVAPLDTFAADWVAVAERFLGSPYQWGGRESLGLDCSGLVQTAMHAAGLPCPRDSDMQAGELGQAAAIDLDRLSRGDLVCWKGHIGIMLDAERLLHANAHHMATAIEPVREAVARIALTTGPVTAVRRL
jgi:cell wall-associated NlpC family hydrolase